MFPQEDRFIISVSLAHTRPNVNPQALRQGRIVSASLTGMRTLERQLFVARGEQQTAPAFNVLASPPPAALDLALLPRLRAQEMV